MAYEFIKDLTKSLAPALIGLGTTLIVNNQNVKNAQGQANATQQALNAQYQIALQNQQNIKLMQQAGQEPPPKEKSNLPLYIGLGVGGVVILGVVIFAVTRKSN
jgi:hypothetical protein